MKNNNYNNSIPPEDQKITQYSADFQGLISNPQYFKQIIDNLESRGYFFPKNESMNDI